MDYFIGIDIGTTSTKAVAFDANGIVLIKESFHYPITHPYSDRSEQSPLEIFNAVLLGLNYIATHLPQHNPLLVSFSAAMHSLILMDENNLPITDCIIWADNRAAKIADELKETEEGKKIYTLSGVPIHAMSPLCKILWFKQNEALLFKRAAKFIGIKEYIFFRLFNSYLIDTGIASATGLLDIKTLQWQQAILDIAGINSGQLSFVVPTTTISYLDSDNNKNEFFDKFPEFTKTAFVIGSSDGALANLGSGAVFEGSMAITIGTSGAVRVVTNKPSTDDKMRSFCYHLHKDQYIIGGASNNGAVVIQWLKENILKNELPYKDFLKLAETATLSENELLFLPYILGERAPIWNAAAKGVFFGLSIEHNPAHIIKAAMEAVVYNMYAIGKILMEKKNIHIIYANGGFTENPFWIQLLCDMFALPVFIPSVYESSALGAVLIGMKALKLPPIINTATGTNYYPSIPNHLILLKRFYKWQRLYNLLQTEF